MARDLSVKPPPARLARDLYWVGGCGGGRVGGFHQSRKQKWVRLFILQRLKLNAHLQKKKKRSEVLHKKSLNLSLR